MTRAQATILVGAFILIGGGILAALLFFAISSAKPRVELDKIAALYEKGDLETSRKRLDAYLKKYPDNDLAWTIYGNVLEDLDRNTEAEQAYHKALALNPKSHQSYTGLGVLYRKKEDYEKAMESYARAVEIEPNYAHAYSSMAIVELILSKDSEALQHAEKAYNLDPNDAVIAANLSVAYHYNGRTADRDRLFEQCKKLGYARADSLQQIFSGELTIRE